MYCKKKCGSKKTVQTMFSWWVDEVYHVQEVWLALKTGGKAEENYQVVDMNWSRNLSTVFISYTHLRWMVLKGYYAESMSRKNIFQNKHICKHILCSCAYIYYVNTKNNPTLPSRNHCNHKYGIKSIYSCLFYLLQSWPLIYR